MKPVFTNYALDHFIWNLKERQHITKYIICVGSFENSVEYADTASASAYLLIDSSQYFHLLPILKKITAKL